MVVALDDFSGSSPCALSPAQLSAPHQSVSLPSQTPEPGHRPHRPRGMGYTAFGTPNATSTTVSVDQRYTYTGREKTTDPNLMYYRWRIYAPTLGRFTARDPIGYTGNPDGNCYSYVGNNSTKYVDGFGLDKKCCVESHKLVFFQEINTTRRASVFFQYDITYKEEGELSNDGESCCDPSLCSHQGHVDNRIKVNGQIPQSHSSSTGPSWGEQDEYGDNMNERSDGLGFRAKDRPAVFPLDKEDYLYWRFQVTSKVKDTNTNSVVSEKSAKFRFVGQYVTNHGRIFIKSGWDT